MRCVFITFLASVLCACSSARASRESPPQISWHWTFDPELSRGGPVSIVVDGHSFVLLRQGTSGCRPLQRSEYRGHDVPDDAISAVAGWFGGRGEEFYARL